MKIRSFTMYLDFDSLDHYILYLTDDMIEDEILLCIEEQVYGGLSK